MLTNERQQHRAILQSIAFRAMIERGLLPNFSTEAITALDKILPPAIIIEMVIGADGALRDSTIYRAQVRNQGKLSYNGVAAWSEEIDFRKVGKTRD